MFALVTDLCNKRRTIVVSGRSPRNLLLPRRCRLPAPLVTRAGQQRVVAGLFATAAPDSASPEGIFAFPRGIKMQDFLHKFVSKLCRICRYSSLPGSGKLESWAVVG